MSMCKRALKAVVIVLVAATFLYIMFVSSLLIYIWYDLCAVDIIATRVSPNGRMTAVIFQKDCGATTAYSTQVALIPAGKRFSAENYPIFLVISGTYPPDLKWVSDLEIEVHIPVSERIYKNERRVNDLNIIYR